MRFTGRIPSALIAVALLAVTACGGATDTEPEPEITVPPTTATDPTEAPAPPKTQVDEESESSEGGKSDSAVSGMGTASVTFDDNTYLFGAKGSPVAQCEPDLFGVFLVVLSMIDPSGDPIPQSGIQLTLLNEGVDPVKVGQQNSANVTIDTRGQEWTADPAALEVFAELEPGSSQVDSYDIDGNHVAGTATFFERNSYFAHVGDSAHPVDVAQGTFEATCGG